MQPRASVLLDLGTWCLTPHREHAMRLVPGMIATAGVDEVLLVCRREPDR
jgi:hypothetical protein